MFFPNGDLHECDFKEGRAEGMGLFLTTAGTEMRGKRERERERERERVSEQEHRHNRITGTRTIDQ
jgi:hypothetical protein